MKRITRVALLVFSLALGLSSLSTVFLASAHAEESWKGNAPAYLYGGGISTGLGIYDNKAGLGMIASLSSAILSPGFAPDINDEVYIEGQTGPLFLSGGTAVVYGGHLRWDFHYDPNWTFFALGGVGGSVTGSNLDNSFRIYPRFGIGAMAWILPQVAIRGEISHELMLVGAAFRF